MKIMKGNFPERWRYFLREIFIVIIGILIAFSLNSWWQNMREHRTLTMIRQNLQDEILLNQKELSETIVIHQIANQNTLQILDSLFQEGKGEVAIPDTVIHAMLICATFDPAEGNINSILNSGQLDLIDNNDLIKSLTSWNRMKEDASEDEEAGFRFVEDQMFPFLRRSIDLTSFSKNSWVREGAGIKFVIEGKPVIVQNSLELQNLLSQRTARLRIIIGALNRIRAHQDEMLLLLDNQ